MQILLSGHIDRFACMQTLLTWVKVNFEICTYSRPSANFAYKQILRIRKSGKIAVTWTDLLT